MNRRIPLHATQRPVREFKRLFKDDIDYLVGGLLDYGYSENQIMEMLELKPKELDAIIIRNEWGQNNTADGDVGVNDGRS